MANDSDLFNRWQAANTFATRTLIQTVEAFAQGRRATRGLAYAKALGATINDEGLDAAYRAELLKLPSQSDIAREIGRNVDPDLIHRAHRRLARLVGSTCARSCSTFIAPWRRGGRSRPTPPTPAAAACATPCSPCSPRAARATTSRAADHYYKAASMTERAHALYLLAAEPVADREGVAHFFERWKDDHIVIDTWFAAQAQARSTARSRRSSA